MGKSARLVQAAGVEASGLAGEGAAASHGQVLGASWAARPSQAMASMAQSLVDAAVEAATQGKARGKHSLPGSKQENALRKRLAADQRENGGVLVITSADAVSVYSVEDWVCLKSWSTQDGGRTLASAAQILPGTSTLVALDEDNQLMQWDYFQEGLQLPAQGSAALGPAINAKARGRKRGSKKSKRTVVELATSPALVGLFVAIYSDGALALRSKDSEIASLAAPDADDDDDDDMQKGTVVSARLVQTASNLWSVLCTETVPTATPALRARAVDLHPHGFGHSRTQSIDVGASFDADGLLAAVPSAAGRLSLVWKSGACAAAALRRSAQGEPALATPMEVSGVKQAKVTCCDAVPSADSSIVLLGAGSRLVAWDASLGVELGADSFEESIKAISLATALQKQEDDGALVAFVLESGNVYVDFLGALAPADGAFAAVTRPSRLVDAAERRRMRKRPRSPSASLPLHGDVSALLSGADVVDSSAWSDALTSVRADTNSDANGKAAPSAKKKKKKSSKASETDAGDASSKQEPEVAHHSVEYVRSHIASLIDRKDWSALEEAIREGLVSTSTNPEVLPALLRAEKVMLLYLCIMYVSDLGESDMVRILRFALSSCSGAALADFTSEIKSIVEAIEGNDAAVAAWASLKKANAAVASLKPKERGARKAEIAALFKAAKKASQNAVRKEHYEGVANFFAELTDEQLAVHYLAMAVMCNLRNEVFFVRAARSLPAECVSSLFEGAASLLVFYEGLPLKSRGYAFNPHSYKGRSALLIPSASHVVSWVSALLDAGLKVIINESTHSKAARQTLERISSISHQTAAFSERLSAIQQPLGFCLRMNRDFTPSSTIGDYAIETVNF
ncbi:Hypothetical Protein FCC1311_029802 [Hondaea fermentalgiana]|uniref:Uncharacterized protein n=1 Tax=Hondaea fermentalgiana TaxID=2315210 RepID=A0A2R5G8U8_9STRA|nr:Hypothetical Protein FCC1311_029802 [Hondaea fermentalgiana]|eukprot:GBG26759.1 Hypothetical Protein FCC1311_029802 [Hondaea fermentalgiana]